jgi:type III secretion protein L
MQDNPSFPPEHFPKSPTTKIIRAAEETAWRDGFHLLAEAQRLQAAERAKGYADGKAAGIRDAGILVIETAAKVDRYLASLESELAHLTLEILRRVIQNFDDAELVARTARTALADLREAKAVTVRVHPSAEGEVRNALADLLASADETPPPITIESDARLDTRGCILSTDFAVIDASVDAQLAAIAAAMLARAKGTGE